MIADKDIILTQFEIYSAEINQMQKSQHQVLFIFVSLIGIAATLFFSGGNKLNIGAEALIYILLGISQVVFLLFIIIITLSSHILILSNYLSTLENYLSENKSLAFYHSKLVPDFINKPSSLTVQGDALIFIIGFIVYILCFIQIIGANCSYLYLLLLELIILSYVGIRFFRIGIMTRKYCIKYSAKNI